MDWKVEAINKLKYYDAKRQALQSIPMELQQLESQMSGIRGVKTDRITVTGYRSTPENRLMDCIVEKEELQRNYTQTKLWVEMVSEALDTLTEEERKLLERFYISDDRGAAEDLAAELYIDRKTVYHRKDAALWKFTVALYGCVVS